MRDRFIRSISVLLITVLPGCMPMMPGMMGAGMVPGIGMPIPAGSPDPSAGLANVANSCNGLAMALADPEIPAATKVQMQQAMVAAGCSL